MMQILSVHVSGSIFFVLLIILPEMFNKIMFQFALVNSYACALKDKDYHGNDVGKWSFETSIEKCSERCKKYASCHAFNFGYNNGHKGSCWLKSNAYANDLRHANGIYAVKRSCKRKYPDLFYENCIHTFFL